MIGDNKTSFEEEKADDRPRGTEDEAFASVSEEDSEDEVGFHEVEKNHVDFVTFTVYHPHSIPEAIQIPLWTVSVQGFQMHKLRGGDNRFLDTLSPELRDAILSLKQSLDPFEMDVELPTLSQSWCRTLTISIDSFFRRKWHTFIHYFTREYQRYKTEMASLRARDLPGYDQEVADVTSKTVVEYDDEEEEPSPQTPLVLPSMANINRLTVCNDICKPFKWFVTLVRTERVPPGSKVIGFRLQIVPIPDEPVPAVAPSILSFPDLFPVRNASSSRRGSTVRTSLDDDEAFQDALVGDPSMEDTTTPTPHVPKKNNAINPMATIQSLFHHATTHPERHFPPLIIYCIEGQKDMHLSTAEVLSYASTSVHF